MHLQQGPTCQVAPWIPLGPCSSPAATSRNLTVGACDASPVTQDTRIESGSEVKARCTCNTFEREERNRRYRQTVPRYDAIVNAEAGGRGNIHGIDVEGEGWIREEEGASLHIWALSLPPHRRRMLLGNGGQRCFI